MSQQTQREDSIEPAEERKPSIDAWKLPEHAREVVARIAVVCGADGEDLAAHKDVFDKWAGDVDTILDVLNISWMGITSLEDTRLGVWELIPIPPELAEELRRLFVDEANARVGKRGEWTPEECAERDRIFAELINGCIVEAAWERVRELSEAADAGSAEGAAPTLVGSHVIDGVDLGQLRAFEEAVGGDVDHFDDMEASIASFKRARKVFEAAGPAELEGS